MTLQLRIASLVLLGISVGVSLEAAAPSPALAGGTASSAAPAGAPAGLKKRLHARGGPAVVLDLPQLQSHIVAQRGRVVLLHLWATWCGPCMHEMPMMANLAKAVRARGGEVLSLSVDTVSPGNLERVGTVISELGENQLTRGVLRVGDPEALVQALDARWDGTIPAVFGYDRNGVLAAALLGAASRNEMLSMLRDLERSGSPDVARQKH